MNKCSTNQYHNTYFLFLNSCSGQKGGEVTNTNDMQNDEGEIGNKKVCQQHPANQKLQFSNNYVNAPQGEMF